MKPPPPPPPGGGGGGGGAAAPRRCRDVLFLVAFAAFWVGMLVVGGLGFARGDPRVLLFGADYRGDLCNRANKAANGTAGADLTGEVAQHWLNPAGAFSALKVGGHAKAVCLRACPAVPANATALRWVCNYPDGYGAVNGTDGHLTAAGCGHPDCRGWGVDEWAAAGGDYYRYLSDAQKADSLALKGPCYPVLATYANVYETCQLTGDFDAGALQLWTDLGGASPLPVGVKASDLAGKIKDSLDTPGKAFNRYIEDVKKSWHVILIGGIVVPFVLSTLWLVVMKYATGLLAWTTVLVMNLGLVALAVLLWMKAGVIGEDGINSVLGPTGETVSLPAAADPVGGSKDAVLGLAAAATAVAALLLLFTLASLKSIRVAIAVIKMGSQAIVAVPSAIVFPLTVPLVAMVALVFYWLFAACFIYSSGDVAQDACVPDPTYYGLGANPACAADEQCQCGYSVKMDETLGYMLIYHFFGLLWTTQFIVAFTLTVLAGAISPYYWSRNNVAAPVVSSMMRTIRYSLGSLAIASFVIAVVQSFRAAMKYMAYQMKKLKHGDATVQYAVCCVDCCLSCLESCLQWLNRNAFIVIAVEGLGYFGAVSHSVSLVAKNAVMVMAVNVFGDTLLFMGKIAVTAVSVIVGLQLLGTDALELSSPFLPVIVTGILAAAVAELFFAVAEMAIDTIMLSYCIDCDQNGGVPKMAPPMMQAALSTVGTATQAKDARAPAGSI